jgi:hypothetical protein
VRVVTQTGLAALDRPDPLGRDARTRGGEEHRDAAQLALLTEPVAEGDRPARDPG